MKLKNIEPNMVVHCNTEEEVKELIKWAYECGFEWIMSKNKFTETHWTANQRHGIYYYFGKFDDNVITYQDMKMDDESIEFSDLIIPEKSDPKFKVGDVVITKAHGESWLVIDVDNSEKTVFYRCIPRFINTYRTYLFKEDEIELSLESEEEPEEELTAEEVIRLAGEICDTSGCNNCCLNNESYLSCDEWKMEHPEEVVEVLKQYKKDHTHIPPKEPEIEWFPACKVYKENRGKGFDLVAIIRLNDNIGIAKQVEEILKDYGEGYTGYFTNVCKVKES